jgi:phosphopantothenoylcysteine decarboxylase/phosphopantothenate--cysteine ligase
MNTTMYRHPAVQRNLKILAERGVELVGPGEGELACGESGEGRLMDLEVIVEAVVRRLGTTGQGDSLKGRRVLVTSGPTREAVDPVRFLSNPSSGRMGHALAAAAGRRGARVDLISGPTSLPDPEGVSVVHVTTAAEMEREVLARAGDADLVLMAAAVSDYRPDTPAASKIKKSKEPLALTLRPVPDILAQLGRRRGAAGHPVLVGFAAESDSVVDNARVKLEAKNLDWVVANRVGRPGSGFGGAVNEVTILSRDGRVEEWPRLTKEEVAERLVDRVATEHFVGRAGRHPSGNGSS